MSRAIRDCGAARRPAVGWRLLGLLLPGLLAGVASASDGVLEINQTCAVQTGCFAGDTAGYPVTIDGSAGASYRLTSNLVLPNENTDGISISTDHISVDLAGFEIRGPVVCSGTPLACTPNAGSGSGVEFRFTNQIFGHSIRNGSIRGMGSYGVQLGSELEVTNLRVRWNRLDGIYAGSGSTVSGNVVNENGRDGIVAFSDSTVSGNSVRSNGGDGIVTTFGSVISGNTSSRNGDNGIDASTSSTVSGNTAFQNGSDGIGASSGSTVSSNTAYGNGGDGIQTNNGATVLGNTVRSNTGFGLNLGSQSGYRENVITFNTAGTVNGTSIVNLGDNACNGSTTCP